MVFILVRVVFFEQARVREITYQGLMKLVVLDPLIAGPVFDLLWPHFRNFYSQVLSLSPSCFIYICPEIYLFFKVTCTWIILLAFSDSYYILEKYFAATILVILSCELMAYYV